LLRILIYFLSKLNMIDLFFSKLNQPLPPVVNFPSPSPGFSKRRIMLSLLLLLLLPHQPQ
jgi:hypothetical protein